MESSTSSSTPNASSAWEPEFLTEANALLPAFERHNFFDESGNHARKFSTISTEYISVQKLLWEFNEVHNYCRNLYHDLGQEMEKRVASYLLGRTYKGSTLKVLICSPAGMEPLCEGLNANPMKVNLHIHFMGTHEHPKESLQPLITLLKRSSFTRGLSISSRMPSYGSLVAQAIRTNKLHELDISNLAFDARTKRSEGDAVELKLVAEAIAENTSIKVLRVQALSPIVKSFVGQGSKANQLFEEMTLVFVGSNILSELKDVLATNQRLLRIRMLNASFSQEMWMEIVTSLKKNTFLQVLDIGGSTGWLDETVLSALLDLVRTHCLQITDFGFNKLPQDVRDNVILKEALPALNEQLRLNTAYGQQLKDAPRGPPRSARVVLCGPGYAGKTTLCKTMMRQNSWVVREGSLFLQKNPKLRRVLYGPDAEKELEKRTRGVNMYAWKDHEGLRISLWDFAGQKEYYALHDYFFPNVNSANLFLFIFSPVPSPLDACGKDVDLPAQLDRIKKELLFWLRFLCSNAKEGVNPIPRVRVVLTSMDRVEISRHPKLHVEITAIFDDFKSQFRDRLNLVGPPVLVNAHSKIEVREVEEQILSDFRDMVRNLELTFTICEDVRRKLGERMLSSSVITFDDYEKICLDVDDMLRSPETRQAVASYLHNVGEIIYFKTLDYIVIDPRWLGVGVLGNLLDVFGRDTETISKGAIGCFQRIYHQRSRDKMHFKNGFLNREGLKTLLDISLKSVTGAAAGMRRDDLIKLLTALEICYEDHHRRGYLIPAALDDVEERAARGLRPLEWRNIARDRASTFIGRRLQCANQDLTSLTPGFFPRLQVFLRNQLVEKNMIGKEDAHFEIDRNLLRFVHNTMDIIIEFGEGEHCRNTFVDVLVQTSANHTTTVQFIDTRVLSVIREFCALPEGNQGVKLVEGIIRPKCVEHLVLCKYRENQAKLISELEEHLRDDPNYQFCWDAVPKYDGLPYGLETAEFDFALDSIKGKRFRQNCDQTIGIQGPCESLEQLMVTFKRLAGEQALPETPKLMFILKDKNGFPLSTSHSELRMRLHLKCEWKHGPHCIQEQRGRSFVVEGELRKTLMPLVQWTYHLFKVGGKVVGKTLPFAAALEVLAEELPAEVPTLAPGFFDRKTLENMGKTEREGIVQYYGEILKASPCCEWLIDFLNLKGDPKKFLEDFSMHKARYKDTKEIAFLCKRCYDEGFKKKALELP